MSQKSRDVLFAEKLKPAAAAQTTQNIKKSSMSLILKYPNDLGHFQAHIQRFD
jgi:hypothetical protein